MKTEQFYGPFWFRVLRVKRPPCGHKIKADNCQSHMMLEWKKILLMYDNFSAYSTVISCFVIESF